MAGAKEKTKFKKFTADEDDKLINFVQEHTVLYDASDPNYKKMHVKDKLWKELSTFIERSGIMIYKLLLIYFIAKLIFINLF